MTPAKSPSISASKKVEEPKVEELATPTETTASQPATFIKVEVAGNLKYGGTRYVPGDVIEAMDEKTAAWLLEEGIVTEAR